MSDHELRFKTVPVGGELWIAPTCTCGWVGGLTRIRSKATDEHEKHRTKATTKGTK